jgi:acyl dehydratase
MAIDYDKLMAWKFDEVEQTYTQKDSMLYALGLGYGADPMDTGQLQYVYEKDLKAAPTMVVVLGYPGMWMRDPESGIDWVRLVHGEQGVTLHAPIPTEGTVLGRTRVTDVVDKGEGKGAIVYTEREIVDKASGKSLATLWQSTFCRADGGFGGSPESPRKPAAIPETAPDLTDTIATLPQAALIYRLSGDYNPLHAEPEIATAAGFDQPILHGLATFGVAGHSILKHCCDYDPSRLKSIQLRFSAPVYPGETIRTEIWQDGNVISFRSKSVERDVVVLNNGRAELN